MDLQKYLDTAVKESRQKTLSISDQLTLGEILEKIEPLLANQGDMVEKYGHEATVVYDFEYLFPSAIDSWRGSYNELALNFETEGEPMGVTKFHEMLTKTVGREFTGYKGGEFVMDKDTPVWVANYSNSGNTAIIGVVDDEYRIILITGYREF